MATEGFPRVPQWWSDGLRRGFVISVTGLVAEEPQDGGFRFPGGSEIRSLTSSLLLVTMEVM